MGGDNQQEIGVAMNGDYIAGFVDGEGSFHAATLNLMTPQASETKHGCMS